VVRLGKSDAVPERVIVLPVVNTIGVVDDAPSTVTAPEDEFPIFIREAKILSNSASDMEKIPAPAPRAMVVPAVGIREVAASPLFIELARAKVVAFTVIGLLLESKSAPVILNDGVLKIVSPFVMTSTLILIAVPALTVRSLNKEASSVKVTELSEFIITGRESINEPFTVIGPVTPSPKIRLDAVRNVDKSTLLDKIPGPVPMTRPFAEVKGKSVVLAVPLSMELDSKSFGEARLSVVATIGLLFETRLAPLKLIAGAEANIDPSVEMVALLILSTFKLFKLI